MPREFLAAGREGIMVMVPIRKTVRTIHDIKVLNTESKYAN
jgi:hypothetical protein